MGSLVLNGSQYIIFPAVGGQPYAATAGLAAPPGAPPVLTLSKLNGNFKGIGGKNLAEVEKQNHLLTRKDFSPACLQATLSDITLLNYDAPPFMKGMLKLVSAELPQSSKARKLKLENTADAPVITDQKNQLIVVLTYAPAPPAPNTVVPPVPPVDPIPMRKIVLIGTGDPMLTAK